MKDFGVVGIFLAILRLKNSTNKKVTKNKKKAKQKKQKVYLYAEKHRMCTENMKK